MNHAVNKCRVQLSGKTETNGTIVIPLTPTWVTVAVENNASQTKEIVANIIYIIKEQKVEQMQKEDKEQNIIICRLKESYSET